MSAILIVVLFLGALFALSYITKRRFGMLGLALCAGSILSTSWATALTPWVENQGVSITAPPLGTVMAVLLVLAPPVALLFSGPTYSSSMQRVIGSAAFALLALLFLLQPIGIAMAFDPTGSALYTMLSNNSSGLIAAGIILAIGDLLMTRTSGRGKK